MNALPQFQSPQFQSPQFQPSQLQPERRPTRKPVRRPGTQTEQQRVAQKHRLMAIESSLRLGVNLGLSAIAVATLVHLLPTRSAHSQKLKEVQVEVAQAEARVAQLQAEFGRSFDSNQVKLILQEQTHMVDPSKRVVIFDDRVPLEGDKTAQATDHQP